MSRYYERRNRCIPSAPPAESGSTAVVLSDDSRPGDVAVEGLRLAELTAGDEDDRFEISPALPSDWREASIRTPDISYDYQPDGDRAVIHIHTPKPLVKKVRGTPCGDAVITPRETESTVTVSLGPSVPVAETPPHPPTILAEQQAPPPAKRAKESPEERARLALFDFPAPAT